MSMTMPTFTIETSYRVPVYRHRTYHAETIEQACHLAIDDDDWTHERRDDESAGETYVSGLWSGTEAAYRGTPADVPARYGDRLQRKADHVENLVGLLKLAGKISAVGGEHAGWLQKVLEAIIEAEAIMETDGDPKIAAASRAFVIARGTNTHADLDYLCGWDVPWGTAASLSLAKALRFSDHAEAEAACERARDFVPTFVDGRVSRHEDPGISRDNG